uniref:Uncharacterized protein n=1 Tax=Arundo donax TaxID=35708 RepID=A0A0A9GIY0_ARUDO
MFSPWSRILASEAVAEHTRLEMPWSPTCAQFLMFTACNFAQQRPMALRPSLPTPEHASMVRDTKLGQP